VAADLPPFLGQGVLSRQAVREVEGEERDRKERIKARRKGKR